LSFLRESGNHENKEKNGRLDEHFERSGADILKTRRQLSLIAQRKMPWQEVNGTRVPSQGSEADSSKEQRHDCKGPRPFAASITAHLKQETASLVRSDGSDA
jgi:hypothetical protein